MPPAADPTAVVRWTVFHRPRGRLPLEAVASFASYAEARDALDVLWARAGGTGDWSIESERVEPIPTYRPRKDRRHAVR